MTGTAAPRRALMILMAMIPAGAFVSCAAPPRSMALSLSLRPGMERIMRFVTEQRIQDTTTAISLTYAFRVVSVDAAGLSTIESTLRDAVVPRADRAMTRAIETLKRERTRVTIDRNGRVIQSRTDQPARFQVPGLPREPWMDDAQGPSRGDIARLFSGFNGRTVSVGETWTSSMPESRGAPGLKGTLHWTLTAVTDTSARLSYAGSVEAGSTPGGAPDGRAGITGEVSGFVSLERATGWPERGRSVIRADATTGPDNATGRRILSISVTTVFDTMP